MHMVLYNIAYHLKDNITHIVSVKNTQTLSINNLTLFVHNLIVFQNIFTNAVVIGLNLHLGFFYCAGKHLVLNGLAFRKSKGIEDAHQPLRAKQTHQIIFQRNVKSGFARIALTSGTTTQLIINSAGFVTLRTDDHQTSQFGHAFSQFDIRTTTSHIRRNRYCSPLSGLSNDLSLHLMEFSVQNFMGNASFFQSITENF